MGVIVFEEEDVSVVVEEIFGGNYVVVFDSFDGFFNIDVVVFMGFIWGIYEFDFMCILDFGIEDVVKIEEKCVMNVC